MNPDRSVPAMLRGVTLAVAASLLGGCAILGGGPDVDQRTVIVYPGGDTSLDPVILPASQLPPAGQCRIWYPDRDPEDQPDPGDCDDLQHRVPSGAVLVRG